MSFSHILITRFNITYEDTPLVCRKGLQEDWLAQRFALFETYCMPSVLGQTNRSFQWLVLFDEHTPEPFRGRIDCHVTEGAYHAVWMSSFDLDVIKANVRRFISPDASHVITTRLDNDDAISRHFVARVQNAFSGGGAK